MPSDEEIKTLAVKIALDASTFTQQAAAFKRQISELDSDFKSSVAGIKNWGSTVDGLKSHVSTLGQQIQVQRQVVESYQLQILRTNAALQAHSKQLLDNRDRVSQLKSAYDQSATTLGKNAEETKAIKVQLDAAQQALEKSEAQVRRNQSAIEGYSIQMNNASAKLKTMEADLKNANSVLFDHTNLFSRAGDALQKAGDKITSAGEKISGVGKSLTAGVTAPIVGIGIAAEKTGMDFEAQMSRVQAISEATGDELKQLTSTAMDLGAKTVYSDQQVAEGMENLASAGFSVQEIMAAMPGMLNLAASSGEDLASSADIAASTLRGFGLAADQAGHVADVLAKNAADTNAAVADTGEAMKYIAPVALNVGWSLEQVTAAIGEMANAGIKGEQAGTTLRGALVNLMNPTDAQTAAMKELGFSAYDSNGKMKSLSEMIAELTKGTSKLTKEQSDQAVATIMGTNSLSGMQVLIKDGSSALDTMTASLKNSTGAAQKMSDTMLDNTKGSIEQMKGSVENAGIALSKALSPKVREAADKVTDLSNKFAKLPEQTQGTIVKFGLLAAAVGPVTLGAGKVAKAIGNTTKAFGKGLSGVSDFVKGIKGITPAAGEAVPIMMKIGMTVAANPWAGVAVSVGLVAAGIGVLVGKYMNAKTPITEITNRVREQDQAWKDLKNTSDEKASSDLAELDNLKRMWDQLQGLVDENGKVLGSKKEVKELTDIINKTTGQNELQLVDDTIKGYRDAKKSIDEYIKTRRAQILLDAYADSYQTAQKNWLSDFSKLQDLKSKIANDQTELNKLSNLTNVKSPADYLKIEKLKKDIASAKTEYSSFKQTVYQEMNLISGYHDAMAAEAEGDYDRVDAALAKSTLKYTTAGGSTQAQLMQQVIDTRNAMSLILNARMSGDINVSDAQISAAQAQYQEAQRQYDKSVGQAGAAANIIGKTYGDGLSGQTSYIYDSGKLLAEAASSGMKSNDSAYAAGILSGNSYLQGLMDTIQNTVITSSGDDRKAAQAEHLFVKKIGHNSLGTNDWRGGLTYINEKGGEIVNAPNGTQIIPHDVSMEIARAIGNGQAKKEVHFNIEHLEVKSDGTKNATLQQLQFLSNVG